MIFIPFLTLAALLLALAAAYRLLCWLDDVADAIRQRREEQCARENARLRERSQIGARRLP
jgi:hypothetical protein